MTNSVKRIYFKFQIISFNIRNCECENFQIESGKSLLMVLKEKMILLEGSFHILRFHRFFFSIKCPSKNIIKWVLFSLQEMKESWNQWLSMVVVGRRCLIKTFTMEFIGLFRILFICYFFCCLNYFLFSVYCFEKSQIPTTTTTTTTMRTT